MPSSRRFNFLMVLRRVYQPMCEKVFVEKTCSLQEHPHCPCDLA